MLTITHVASNSNAQQTMSRLEVCNTSFMRQSSSLVEASQTAVTLIQKAGMSFGEQAGKMLDTSHQMDQSLRQLTATTSALADQSAQIRATMEQHNQRLIAQLTEAVTQLGFSGNKLEQSVATASTGIENVSARFNEVTQGASNRLNATQQDLQGDREQSRNDAWPRSAPISHSRASSLSVTSEQLSEQYRTLASASESQRTQLVDLFDRLGAAHSEASEVAERTITRLNEALAQIQRNPRRS